MKSSVFSAARLLQCMDAQALIDRADRAYSPTVSDLAAGEAIAADILAARRARGERPLGWKIGFTNRSIWPIYGVTHPIWGPIYDSTLHLLDTQTVRVDRSNFVQGRLEPEIVIRLAVEPADSSAQSVLAACEWIAHGYEIVQSPYPDWKFSAAEGLAAQGLHGALLVGRRFAPAALGERSELILQRLSEFSLVLDKNGSEHARGTGAAVLDGPMQALSHLMQEFAKRGRRLQAGDVITTGTLTDAQPLQAGDLWQTRIDGIALPGLALEVI
jgi:2-oxo-3-hexenedioate decarboxylase